MSPRAVYKWCPVQKKVVPADEVMVEIPANVAHRYISDDMPPTRSPLDGKYYTSKSKLRETYRAAGVYEVGNDFEHYEPEKEQQREERELLSRVRAEFRERIKGG